MSTRVENTPGVQDSRFGWRIVKKGAAVISEATLPTVAADVSRSLRNSSVRPETTDSWTTLAQAGSAILLYQGRPLAAGVVYAGSKVVELGEVAKRKFLSGKHRSGR